MELNVTSISSDTPPPAIPELIEPPSKKPKIVRDKITSEKLSFLLASHRKHYEIWSNGRKKAGKQVTPKGIWPKVGLGFLKLALLIRFLQIYADYKKEFPGCSLSEEQLKFHIRNEKKDLQTGDADDKLGKIVLQPSDLLEKIKQTDGHAKRNVIAKQENFIAKLDSNSDSGLKSKKPSVQRTKAQMFDQQATSIAALSSNIERMRKSQEELMKARADLARLDKLKDALNLGLIDQAEFNKRAAALLLN